MESIAKIKKQPWYKEINRSQWNSLTAAFLGWTLDAFDFLLYNYVIATLIKEWGLTTAHTGAIVSLSIIASALGGVCFGYIADRIGRIKALTMTVFIYSIATGLCGLTTNIWQLGIARVIVGLGMGGEWSAGAALISETWPKEHRSKAMSIMQCGYAFGGFVGALVVGPMIHSFGWRPVFFLGIIPALLVYWIRKNVEEPEIWKNTEDKQKSNTVNTKWIDIFRGNMLKYTILGSVFCTVAFAASYPITTWLPTYFASPIAKGGLGLSTIQSSMYNMPYYIGCIFGYLVFGFLSDKVNRKVVFFTYFLGALIIFPIFIMTGVKNLPLFLLLVGLVGFFAVGFYGGFGAVLAEYFPTSLRASGQGFCYNVGRAISAFAIMGAGTIAMRVGIGKAISYSSLIFIVAILTLLILPNKSGVSLENVDKEITNS